MRESVGKLTEFDACEDVLTIVAHVTSLLGVVGLFPEKRANGWKEEGWRGGGRVSCGGFWRTWELGVEGEGDGEA